MGGICRKGSLVGGCVLGLWAQSCTTAQQWCQNGDQSLHEELPFLEGNMMASARMGTPTGRLLGFMVGSKRRSSDGSIFSDESKGVVGWKSEECEEHVKHSGKLEGFIDWSMFLHY